jgi:hypothetical protein
MVESFEIHSWIRRQSEDGSTIPPIGGRRSSTVRQPLEGQICGICKRPLQPRHLPAKSAVTTARHRVYIQRTISAIASHSSGWGVDHGPHREESPLGRDLGTHGLSRSSLTPILTLQFLLCGSTSYKSCPNVVRWRCADVRRRDGRTWPLGPPWSLRQVHGDYPMGRPGKVVNSDHLSDGRSCSRPARHCGQKNDLSSR